GVIGCSVCTLRVAAPLPDVAVNVVQPPRVRGERADIRGLFSTFPLWRVVERVIPVVVREIGVDHVTEVVFRRGSGPAGIFPLRFRRQPDSDPPREKTTNLRTELATLVPRHGFDRPVRTFEVTRVGAHDS